MRELELKIQSINQGIDNDIKSKEVKDVVICKKQIKTRASFEFEEPSEELLQWAKDNINEDPDKRDLFVSELRDMIYERGECTPTRIDDEYLLRFLRARHFIVRKSHRLFVNYHNFLEEVPQYFTDINFHRFMEIKKKNMINIPPNRDQLGRKMIILNASEWDPSEFSPTELFQFLIFGTQMGLMEQETQIKGGIVLVNLSGLSLEMLFYATPTLIRHVFNYTVNAVPSRLEEIHYIYTSWMFDKVYSLVKPLIPENLKDRVICHNDLDTLYDYVDPTYLPKSLGGLQEDYPLESWYNDVKPFENEQVRTEVTNLGYPIHDILEAVKAMNDSIDE